MNNYTKFPIALAKEACRLCGKIEDGPILIKKRAVKADNNEFEDKLHGKTIGYMEKPCKDCQEIMDRAFLLIGIVEAKTDDHNNPYRSGNKWGITLKAAQRMLGKDNCKKGIAFIDVLVAQEIGFPNVNLNA